MNLLFRLEQAVYLGICDFRLFWGWKSWVIGWSVRNATAALAFVLVAQAAGRPDALASLALGYTLYAGCAATLWAVPASTWVRTEGILTALLATPAGFFFCTTGRGAVWIVNGIATSVMLQTGFAAYFGTMPDGVLAIRCLCAFACACLSTYAFGIAWGLVALFVPPLRNVIGGLLGTAILAFSGAVVPTSFWPDPLPMLAKTLPAYHAASALDTPLGGNGWLLCLSLELLVALGWMAAASIMARWVAAGSRRFGYLQE